MLPAVPPSVWRRPVGRVVGEGSPGSSGVCFKGPRRLQESRLWFGSRRGCQWKGFPSPFPGGASERSTSCLTAAGCGRRDSDQRLGDDREPGFRRFGLRRGAGHQADSPSGWLRGEVGGTLRQSRRAVGGVQASGALVWFCAGTIGSQWALALCSGPGGGLRGPAARCGGWRWCWAT